MVCFVNVKVIKPKKNTLFSHFCSTRTVGVFPILVAPPTGPIRGHETDLRRKEVVYLRRLT